MISSQQSNLSDLLPLCEIPHGSFSAVWVKVMDLCTARAEPLVHRQQEAGSTKDMACIRERGLSQE